MLNVIDVIRYNLYKCSHEIHKIKVDALVKKVDSVTSWNPETNSYSKNSVVKIVSHIDPKKDSWRKYVGLKREVTRLLNYLSWQKYRNSGGVATGPISYQTRVEKIKKDIDEDAAYLMVVNEWTVQRNKEIEERAKKKNIETIPFTTQGKVAFPMGGN